MPGCLKMYMDCKISGRENPKSTTNSTSSGFRENSLKTGSRSWSAWPILLIECSFGSRKFPSAPNASSSKKKRILSPDSKKYSSLERVCWRVEKIETTLGSNSATSTSTRARNRSQSEALQKSSITRKPLRSYLANCSGLSCDIKFYEPKIQEALRKEQPRAARHAARAFISGTSVPSSYEQTALPACISTAAIISQQTVSSVENR